MTKIQKAPVAIFAVAAMLIACSAVPLAASSISLNYTGTENFTYITAPGGSSSQDSFSANLTDATFGSGTLNVTGDSTNYTTGTGSSGPDSAVFSFGAGTFSGSSASVINFANGTEVVTFTVTDGTGTFAGYSGSIIEDAHFTSFGSFSPNVPATLDITAATGTLVSAPEPSTFVVGLLGGAVLLLVGMTRKHRAS